MNSQLRNNNNGPWAKNYRLYPSLRDALSPKPHPLNIVHISDNKNKHRSVIGFEEINRTISNKSTSPKLSRSKTYDESIPHSLHDDNEVIQQNGSKSNENGKQRFKRRGRNRPSSPLPATNDFKVLSISPKQSETNLALLINRKKKKKSLSSESNLNLSSSSSQSLNDERKTASNERRRQREDRQKELVRFRRSQEIQRELDEIEEKRMELDKRHSVARQNLNTSMHDDNKRTYWERECLCIVRERTALQRAEDELIMAKRGLTLENERARAENEYRQLINLPDELKTPKDREREEQLITTIAKLVETRNGLTNDLEHMRLREMQEDECLRHAFELQGIENQTTSSQILDVLKDII